MHASEKRGETQISEQKLSFRKVDKFHTAWKKKIKKKRSLEKGGPVQPEKTFRGDAKRV